MKPLKFISFCLLIAVLFVFSASAAGDDISPAINFLRKSTTLTKCSIAGETVNFSSADFKQTIGNDLEYIVISALPENGVLTLNGVKVVADQTIPVSSLDYLKFIPNSSAAKSYSFKFTTRATGWEDAQIPCVVNVVENTNFSPVANNTKLVTIQDVCVFGALDVIEPDKDSVTYNIVKFPRNGFAKIGKDGSIVYTPQSGYTGKDSLVYTATDVYGNVSTQATVEITVAKNETGIFFSDMKTSRDHLAAIRMAQNAIMTYSTKESQFVFEPDKTVTKIDFLVMLMNATGIDKNIAAVADTKFLDDTKLSVGRKGYLARALDLGIITLGEGVFNPLDTITKAQAAVLTAAALSLPELNAKQTFVDSRDVPQWAATAVASSTNLGIFAGEKGYFSPNKELTRGEVAVVLSNVLDYMQANNVVPIDNLT